MDLGGEYVRAFTQRNSATSLMELDNCDRSGSPAFFRANVVGPKGVEMRLVAAFVAICALSQTAIAQTPACKSIADPGPRLACYDKAAPPATLAGKPAAARPAAPASAAYLDPIGAEDARMNAQLKNICRGC